MENNKNVDMASEKMYDAFDLMKYASKIRQLVDLKDTRDSGTASYSSFTKDDILTYLRSPANQNNEKRLRKASIQMFTGNMQYWRLVMHYAMMPAWIYSIVPRPFNTDGPAVNKEAVNKQLIKVSEHVSKMSIEHEMRKAMQTVFTEGVLYGVVWQNADTWYIQKIDADYCKLSSIADGTYLFAVDMSKIKDTDLMFYPEEFRTMYNAYQSTGVKWQEVPERITFCLKANEHLSYNVPPFAAALPAIYDLEAYKDLARVATELNNYKLVAMEVPTDNEGKLTLGWDRIMEFYTHLANALPPEVGAAAVPMKLNAIDFERSGVARDTDETESATRHFWYTSGTSPLLFGDAANTSSSALSLSIKAGEGIVLSIVKQCERVLNRHMKYISGNPKFKLVIHPVTSYNYEAWVKYLKDAGTLGLPVKLAYNSISGVEPGVVSSMTFVENDVLKLVDKFKPLTSSYMQSGETGRPEATDDEIGDAGEQTRETGGNENK